MIGPVSSSEMTKVYGRKPDISVEKHALLRWRRSDGFPGVMEHTERAASSSACEDQLPYQIMFYTLASEITLLVRHYPLLVLLFLAMRDLTRDL